LRAARSWSVLGAVTVLLVIAVVAGCNVSGVSRDPSVARLRNDLSTPVELRLCKSDECDDGFYPPKETLDPGDTWPVNVSSIGVPNVYLVQSSAGDRYGCLPLVSPKLRHDEITVLVSEHIPCRDHLDEESFWPPRWERLE
jgi:hypothetical protein